MSGMIPNIIAFTGPIGSGKSLIADMTTLHLDTYWGRECTKLPFAGYLKSVASSMGWDGQKDANGRRLLQQLGSGMRNLDIDYWIKKWTPGAIYAIEYSEKIVIVDDLRYDNEAKTVREMGGITVQIMGRIGLNEGVANHESEQGVSAHLVDYFFMNSTKTQSDLFDCVRIFWEEALNG